MKDRVGMIISDVERESVIPVQISRQIALNIPAVHEKQPFWRYKTTKMRQRPWKRQSPVDRPRRTLERFDQKSQINRDTTRSVMQFPAVENKIGLAHVDEVTDRKL
jgi:hypothetical protein